MYDAFVRTWWVVALRGIIAILFGLVALFMPGIALASLITLFGAYVLVDGIFGIIGAVHHYHIDRTWWVLLIEALVSVVAGVAAFVMPGLTALVLLYLVAGWAIVSGLLEMIVAFQLHKVITKEIWLGLAGLASILFGIGAILFPGAATTALVTVMGAYALVFGVLLVLLAFKLRKPGSTLHNRMLTPANR